MNDMNDMINNVDNMLVNQAGGARNQGQYLSTYVGEKLNNLFTLDTKAVYSIVENSEYLVISILLSYIYAIFLNKMFPIKYSFGKEKLALDLVLHIFSLSLGYYFIPKAIKVFPSIFHSSVGFTAYQTDAYAGTFVAIFLSLFSFNSISAKLRLLMRKFGAEGFGAPSDQSPGIDENTGRVENENETAKELVDENTRPAAESRKQQLPQSNNKYPNNGSVPTVSEMNHQEAAAYSPPQATRDHSNDGTDIRNFLNQVNQGHHQQQAPMQMTEAPVSLSMGDMVSGMAPF